MALGMLATSVVSLAAQLPQLQFYVLDGQRQESPAAGFWPHLAKQLPLDIAVAPPTDSGELLHRVAGELQRRLDASDDAADPIFLILHNLARFRELRKSEDFNFSLDDDAGPSPDKLFSTILREGPNYGVHTLIWCDSFTNLNRWVDRQGMHDLALRVLFQMSGGDSANLMDSPEASRLGVHRAILYNDEQGEYEKFRPYGLPGEPWLRWVKQRLQDREPRTG
jgi:hypothetical protein